jgi:phosphatidylserine decarboxylase
VGQVSEGRLVQAKGMTYTLSDLLGGNAELAGKFDKGEFITLYLAPRDYHRVHMPVTGKLMSMTYVPGKLLSVNQATTNTVDNLFARNERLITVFHTDAGSMALIMVGAIFVGSMETVWAGEVTPAQVREPSSTIYAGMSNAIHIQKGEEMGRFNMGSTVILLFEKGKLTWEKQISADAGVRMGKKIGELIKTGN